MKKDPCPNDTRIELARIDERIKGLMREIALARELSASALKLSADELARRLDDLNHAHAQSVADRRELITRPIHEAALKELDSRLGSVIDKLSVLDGDFREFRGRLWLPLVGAATVAAGLAAAVIKLAAP